MCQLSTEELDDAPRPVKRGRKPAIPTPSLKLEASYELTENMNAELTNPCDKTMFNYSGEPMVEIPKKIDPNKTSHSNNVTDTTSNKSGKISRCSTKYPDNKSPCSDIIDTSLNFSGGLLAQNMICANETSCPSYITEKTSHQTSGHNRVNAVDKPCSCNVCDKQCTFSLKT
ncbi:unnamed protein product [Leptidea sinapis]|uniref:Uncharacterized protein n=1 Tax=Leptidea sinapis TaxID=189913 RepID=A0A5E4QCU7_9NEOP|nr:unnamed protein product [Leptidea sinapis]